MIKENEKNNEDKKQDEKNENICSKQETSRFNIENQEDLEA